MKYNILELSLILKHNLNLMVCFKTKAGKENIVSQNHSKNFKCCFDLIILILKQTIMKCNLS